MTHQRLAFAVLLLPALVLLSSCAKSLTFGTATKFGLDISQRADQMIDVSLGYDRVEVVSIPALEENATDQQDTYSVLGIFSVQYGNPWKGEPLKLDQFFATGQAAKKAANTPGLQQLFGVRTRQIIEKKPNAPKEEPR